MSLRPRPSRAALSWTVRALLPLLAGCSGTTQPLPDPSEAPRPAAVAAPAPASRASALPTDENRIAEQLLAELRPGRRLWIRLGPQQGCTGFEVDQRPDGAIGLVARHVGEGGRCSLSYGVRLEGATIRLLGPAEHCLDRQRYFKCARPARVTAVQADGVSLVADGHIARWYFNPERCDREPLPSLGMCYPHGPRPPE